MKVGETYGSDAKGEGLQSNGSMFYQDHFDKADKQQAPQRLPEIHGLKFGLKVRKSGF